MITTRRRVSSTLAIALAAACGPFRGGSEPRAELIFRNESMEQADVYAVVRSGVTPLRIGTVFAGRTDTLVVRGTNLASGSPVEIVARLLASSGAPRTGPVTIVAGDRLAVTLSSDAKVLTVTPPR